MENKETEETPNETVDGNGLGKRKELTNTEPLGPVKPIGPKEGGSNGQEKPPPPPPKVDR